ncbi:MAG: M24 family metallopeptidase [Terracidiphilus sp.]
MSLEYHEFDRNEYELRFRRARALMEQERLDAILVGDEKNYRYFTGDRSPTKNRPTFVLLFLEADPIVIASEFGAKTAKFITSISDVRGYPLPFTCGIVADAIRSRRVKRVGVECDDQVFGAFYSSMQWGEFDRLKGNLPEVEFLDASSLLWKLRVIKTEAEIECLKKAAEITALAYCKTFAESKPGMREKEMAALFTSHMALLGADIPFRGKPGPSALVILDSNHPAGDPPVPTDKCLQNGDIVHMDGGAIYKGYCSDFSRAGVVGEPTPRQLDEWRKARELVEENVSRLKPGSQFKVMTCHFHGIGLDAIEPPFGGMLGNALHGEWVMQEGMTICVEQNNYLGSGEIFAYEDIAVIRKNGPEVITLSDPNLQIIRGLG